MSEKTIKAITLFQPWASLVAMGEKRIETRSWSTRYRGPLAIHAGMNSMHMNVIMEHPFSDVFGDNRMFPFGAVVAVCKLVDCVPTARIIKGLFIACELGFPYFFLGLRKLVLVQHEFAFGDYSPGRYAWILDEVEMLPEPISAKGMLGLWDWEMPESEVNYVQ
jgi:hypothetical protein